MKKTTLLVVFALILGAFSIAQAEDSSELAVEGSIDPSTSVSSPVKQVPPVVPANIREKLRQDYETKVQNVKNNQTARNTAVDAKRAIATSTSLQVQGLRMERREEVRAIATSSAKQLQNLRAEGRDDMRPNASTSGERKDIRQEAREDIKGVRIDVRDRIADLRIQKIFQEMRISINNLKQIRERINTAITKASTGGRDMSAARSALVTADAKIVLAENSLTSFQILASTTIQLASTTPNDTAKIQQASKTTREAIHAARESLAQVVKAIVKVLNIKTGIQASSTTSVQ